MVAPPGELEDGVVSDVIEVSWLGHATVLVQDRARILTDPVLTPTLMHLHRRAGPVPPAFTEHVDAVVVSHLHHDHLHLPSLALLHPGTPVLLPRGGGPVLRRSRLEAVEVSAGDVVEVGDASVAVVPAVHDDRRLPWSRVRGAPVGFVLRGAGTTYFAGDTSLFPEMGDVADSPDVALLPVGGWGPSLRGHHMDPEDAARGLALLDASVAVPIHYGTFWPRGIPWLRTHLFHEPGRDFAAHARRLAPRSEVRVIPPGTATTVGLPRPSRLGG
jgi:L-ascorbate metabolism protein UlaG (beta-lactamase superfamily)